MRCFAVEAGRLYSVFAGTAEAFQTYKECGLPDCGSFNFGAFYLLCGIICEKEVKYVLS